MPRRRRWRDVRRPELAPAGTGLQPIVRGQQRVLIARTLLQLWPSLNPTGQVLLLDEPLAGWICITR